MKAVLSLVSLLAIPSAAFAEGGAPGRVGSDQISERVEVRVTPGQIDVKPYDLEIHAGGFLDTQTGPTDEAGGFALEGKAEYRFLFGESDVSSSGRKTERYGLTLAPSLRGRIQIDGLGPDKGLHRIDVKAGRIEPFGYRYSNERTRYSLSDSDAESARQRGASVERQRVSCEKLLKDGTLEPIDDSAAAVRCLEGVKPALGLTDAEKAGLRSVVTKREVEGEWRIVERPSVTAGVSFGDSAYRHIEAPSGYRADAADITGISPSVHGAFRLNETVQIDLCAEVAVGLLAGQISNKLYTPEEFHKQDGAVKREDRYYAVLKAAGNACAGVTVADLIRVGYDFGIENFGNTDDRNIQMIRNRTTMSHTAAISLRKHVPLEVRAKFEQERLGPQSTINTGIVTVGAAF